MQIICPICDKRLQISEDKLPEERQVRITCPKCRKPFVFDPIQTKTNDRAQQVMPASETKMAQPKAEIISSVMQLPTRNSDLTDMGPTPRALVCLDDLGHRKAFETILPELGFNTLHIIPHLVDALTYVTQVTYECIILDMTFDGSSQEANPIMACVIELPMEQRRRMLVALCTSKTEPQDSLAAYSRNANLMLSHADIPKCHRLLEQKMAEQTRLYRMYLEIRESLGKI
jgi:CheY-like chemotaxis protein